MGPDPKLAAMKGDTHPEPLSKRRLFQTTELDEARAVVADKFCDHRLNIETHADRFDACHHRAEGHSASLNYIRYGADVRIEPGELGTFYLVQIPLSGSADIDNCAGQVQTHAGRGSVLNPHRDTRMRWREGCAQLLLQIDARALQAQAERLLGMALSGPVTFETAVDAKRPATAAWIRKLWTCFDLTEKNAVFGSDQSGTQMRVESELIADFLLSQPSDISSSLVSAPGMSANHHVRRAVQFMQANLTQPITLSEIASASGTTPRSLQLYFRSEFDLSPMRYLKLQRLALARSLIVQSKGDGTVGDIVLRAGFSHFGRFSAEYRKVFGEAPSDTNRHAMQTERQRLGIRSLGAVRP